MNDNNLLLNKKWTRIINRESIINEHSFVLTWMDYLLNLRKNKIVPNRTVIKDEERDRKIDKMLNNFNYDE